MFNRWDPKFAMLLIVTIIIVMMACAAVIRIWTGGPDAADPATDPVVVVATPLPQNARAIQYNVEGINVVVTYLPEKEIRTLAERPDVAPPPTLEPTQPEQAVTQETIIVQETVVVTATPDPNAGIIVTPQPPIQPNSGTLSFVQYTVQPNDTLYSLSRSYNTTIELMATHGIDIDDMIVGNVINIPVPSSSGNVSCGANQSYIVQPGDNTYRLGIRFNTNEDVLRQMNNLDGNYTIYVGQILCIP